MNRIPVAIFSHRAKAEPLQRRLVESGLQAEIHDELRLEKLWFVSKPAAGVRIEVPVQQSERAQQLLLAWDMAEQTLQGAIRCPECKSLRVDYPQFTRKSMFTNLAMGLMAELRLVDKEYYCQDCHYTWPKDGAKPSRARPHMAPYFFIEGVEQTASGQQQPQAMR
jgi:predicted Zn-ribbon and HTH transcriptional regulator